MDFLNVLPLVVAESNAGAAIVALIGGLVGTALFPSSTHGTSSSTSSVMVG